MARRKIDVDIKWIRAFVLADTGIPKPDIRLEFPFRTSSPLGGWWMVATFDVCVETTNRLNSSCLCLFFS